MIDQIHKFWPTWVPNHPQIDTIHPTSQSRYHTVWKVTTTDQNHFAIKHHLFASLTQNKPYDLLQVEKQVTSCLLDDDVPVPPIVATIPQEGLIIYDWCGDQTLDDVCQHHLPQSLPQKIINTLRHLEHSFQKHTPQLTPYIAPGSTQQDTQTAFKEATTTLTQALPHLIPPNNHSQTQLQKHWQNIQTQIQKAPLSLGPTDYNARNIVLSNTHQPHILELAKIGYDWPERRLVQYTTSLGAHLSTGQIIGCITPQIAQNYAQKAAQNRTTSADQILTTLDRHHLIFYLFATLQCLQAHNSSNHPWQNIDTRLNNIRTALSIPLSNCESTQFFRTLFQT